MLSVVENLDGYFLFYEVGEMPAVSCGFHEVVVYPVVIAAARFSEDDTVVFESVLLEPDFCVFAVCFGA